MKKNKPQKPRSVARSLFLAGLLMLFFLALAAVGFFVANFFVLNF